MQSRWMAALVVVAAATAHAQPVTTGAVQGRVTHKHTRVPLAGVMVTIEGPATIGPQTAITDADGMYLVTGLPPGTYEVTFSTRIATTKRVRVRALAVTTVNLDLGASGESLRGRTQDRTYFERVPVPGRGFEGAAGAHPAAHGDGLGIAVAGSTSLENRYLVDGIDITGVGYGFPGTHVMSELIEQTDLILGGADAAWGRATGGIVHVTTRSGTNQLRGSVFGTLTPGFLARSAIRTASETSPIDVVDQPGYQADLGVEVGGPVIRDRAFFHVAFAPQLARTDHVRITKRRTDCRQVLPNGELSECDPRLPGMGGHADTVPDIDPVTGAYLTEEVDREIRSSTLRRYTTLAKLDLAVDPRNQAQLSVLAVPWTTERPGLLGLASTGLRESGLATDAALRWTSKLPGGRTELDATIAWHRATHRSGAIDPALAAEPAQLLLDGSLGTYAGLGGESTRTQEGCADGSADDRYPFITNCPMSAPYAIGGPGALDHDREERRTAAFGATHRIAGHELRAGADLELLSRQNARLYSGGATIRHFGSMVEVTRFVELAPQGTTEARFDQRCISEEWGQMGPMFRQLACDFLDGTAGAPGTLATANTLTWSAYLQDAWQLSPSLLVRAGLRYEEQRLRYASDLRETTDVLTGEELGTNALVLSGNLAPRLGVIWDPTGRGASRVFATWGRFFEAIPLSLNERGFGRDAQYVQQYTASSCGPSDPRIGAPDGRGCLDPAVPPGRERLLGSGPFQVAPGLRAPYLDEIVVGGEYELARDLRLGLVYHRRSVGRILEDVSSGGRFVLANPGEWSEDAERALEQQIARTSDGTERARLEDELAAYRGIRRFDRPTREHDAIEVSLTGSLARGAWVQAAYTYSQTRGNYTGAVSYDNGQIAPHLTSQFDLVELLANRHGPLPQDRPHALKIDGHYTIELGPEHAVMLGGRFRASSGIPRNALGSQAAYGSMEAFLLPRGTLGRTDFVHGLDLRVAYGRKLTGTTSGELYLDVFNVYDRQEAFAVDEVYAPDYANVGANHARAVSGGRYEDLVFAKAHDASGLETARPLARNPSFGTTTRRYAPLSARIGFRVSF